MEPEGGISGETLFQLECDDFTEEAVITVIQDGVFLILTKSKYPGPFWLAESNNDLFVIIGDESFDVQSLDIPVIVTSFFKNITSYEDRENILKKRLFGDGPQDYKYLLQTKHYTEILQLASLLNTALVHLSKEQPTYHYNNHIIQGIVQSIPYLDSHVLYLLSKLGGKMANLNWKSMPMLMEGLYKVCVYLDTKNPFYNKVALEQLIRDYIALTSRFVASTIRMKPENSIDIDSDYPSLVDISYPKVDYKEIVKLVMHFMLKAVNCIGDLTTEPKFIDPAEDQYNIKIHVDWLNFEKKFVPTKIPSAEETSYFNISTQLLQSLKAMNTSRYEVSYFSFNPVMWDDVILNTSVLQLRMKVDNKLNYPIDVFFETNKKPGVIHGETINRTVYEFRLKGVSLFIVKFLVTGANIKVAVTDELLGQQLPRNVKFTTIDQSDIKLNVTSTTSFAFVTIEGDGTLFNYEFEYLAEECLYWKNNQVKWRNDKCILYSSEDNYMHCKCWHLSLFAGRAIVPEHRIYQNTAIPSPESDRFRTIPIVTLTVVFIFLCLMAYTKIKDRKMISEYRVDRVKDNTSSGQELYLIGVVTGIQLSAGTTSNVFLKLHGELGSSKAFYLNGNGKKITRNSELFFTVSSKNLGPIKQVEIWHDSKGKRPHWFCERVMVEHLGSGEIYQFIVEQWLSLLKGTGLTNLTIPVSKGNPPLSFAKRIRESFRIHKNLFSLFFQRPRKGQGVLNVFADLATVVVLMVTALYLQSYVSADQMSVYTAGIVSSIVALMFGSLLETLLRVTSPVKRF